MNKEFRIYDGSCNVSYEETQEKKEKVFESIISWLKKHNCSSGEMLCQNDDCIIDAPDLISDIVDNIIKFNVEHLD